MEYKNTPRYLLLQKYHECLIHNLDLINFITCELDLTSIPFIDKTIITCEIKLPPSGNIIGFSLLSDEYFTIYFTVDTIPNSPAGHQLPTQANKMCG